jgi:hypothetical protein
MPNPFSITAATDTIPLDAQGRGSTTFTVSNISGQLRRGRARLVPSDPGHASWLSVEGDAERNFAADGTHQYTVRVAAPPGTAAGSYTFGLDVVSVENPDEEWSQGPKVRFEVAPSQPPKKPFPWWILAVVAAVLVVGGLIAWLVSRNGNDAVGLGEICAPGEQECTAGLACSDVATGGKRCLGDEGFAGCGKTEDCVSGLICRSGTCTKPAGVLESCKASEDCATKLTCIQVSGRGLCLGQAGFSPCDSDRACADGLACQGQVCRGVLRAKCAADAECGEGLACVNGSCLGAPGFKGCGGDDESCIEGLVCVPGKDTCLGPLGFEGCDADTDCVAGFVCAANKRCLLPAGAPCPSSGESCASGRCEMRWREIHVPIGPPHRIPEGFFCQ